VTNFWQGPHIRLRAIEPGDIEAVVAWNLDSDLGRHIDCVWPPQSRESVRQWIERMAAREPVDDVFFFIIENPTGEVVGQIDTHHVSRRTGTFMYGVSVRAEHRRRGYASEAILLVLRYYFEELRYQKVTVEVHADNPASLRLHERLGFQQEGRLRRMLYTGGQYVDVFMLGMTAEEFRALPGSRQAAQLST
jgi:RimJ/RimL family protein N-acetyltransferase